MLFRHVNPSLLPDPPEGESRLLVDHAGNLTLVNQDRVAQTLDIGAVQALVSGAGAIGRVVCDWSPGLGTMSITSGTGTAALDPSVMIGGKPAMKYTPGAAAETGVARYVPTNPVRIQDIRSIQIPVIHTAQYGTLVGGTGIGTGNVQVWINTSTNKQLRLYLRDAGIAAGGANVYTWSASETTDTLVLNGGAVWLQPEGSGTVCSVENETVTFFQIAHFSSTASAAYPLWFGSMYVNRAAERGAVALRLDKNSASQYAVAWPIMQQHAVKATLALLTAAIGTGGNMTAAQIGEMVTGGCDVALHTHTTTKTTGYANATDWPTADAIAQDIAAGFKVIRLAGWRQAPGLLIEGFTGGYTTGDIVRQRLLQAAFENIGVNTLSTLQGVSASYRQQGYIGPQIGGASMRRLQCQVTLQATTDVSFVLSQIAQAAADKTLMSILVHDVVADSATPVGTQIRSSDFAVICAAIRGSGAQSLTMGEAMRLA